MSPIRSGRVRGPSIQFRVEHRPKAGTVADEQRRPLNREHFDASRLSPEVIRGQVLLRIQANRVGWRLDLLDRL